MIKIEDIIINNDFKNALRSLNDLEYCGLRDDILGHNCVINPLIVWRGRNILVDGHHRYSVIVDNPGVSYTVIEQDFESSDDVLEWIYGHQGNRRNATPEEISYYRGKEYELKKKNSKTQSRSNQYLKVQGGNNCHPAKKTETELSEKYNIGERSIRYDNKFSTGVDTLAKVDITLRDDILAGKSDLKKKDVIYIKSQVDKATVEHDRRIKQIEREKEELEREEKEQQDALLQLEEERRQKEELERQLAEEKLKRDEIAKAEAERLLGEREEKKRKKKEEKEKIIQDIRNKIIENPIQSINDSFDVVILDPPWEYGRKYDPDSSRIASPYPEQSIDEIYNDIKSKITFKDNSVMWLWTTHKFLFNAKELMDRWGFTYKATLVWDKQRLGMGSYLRMQCEFCLLGIRGKPIMNLTNHRDLISEPRREHSRKPVSFYEMVKSLCVGNILEYHSREKKDGIFTIGVEDGKLA